MEDKIICTNCSWSWNREDGGDDMYICHKCGNNNFYTQNNLFKKKEKGGKLSSWFNGQLSFLNW